MPLNAILRWKFKDPNLIFVVNDPAIVKCGEKFHSAKRKPDIILISVDYARQLLGNLKPFTFAECCEELPKIKPKLSSYWTDVYQSWELKLGTHEISPDALRGEHKCEHFLFLSRMLTDSSSSRQTVRARGNRAKETVPNRTKAQA